MTRSQPDCYCSLGGQPPCSGGHNTGRRRFSIGGQYRTLYRIVCQSGHGQVGSAVDLRRWRNKGGQIIDPVYELGGDLHTYHIVTRVESGISMNECAHIHIAPDILVSKPVVNGTRLSTVIDVILAV